MSWTSTALHGALKTAGFEAKGNTVYTNHANGGNTTVRVSNGNLYTVNGGKPEKYTGGSFTKR